MTRNNLMISNTCFAERFLLHRVTCRCRTLMMTVALIFYRVRHARLWIH